MQLSITTPRIVAALLLVAVGACADGTSPATSASDEVATVGRVASSVASTPLTLDANGDATVSVAGHYTSSENVRTVTISASDVTLDGITFVGRGAAAGVRNSVAGLRNITIKNSTFSGYTGRSITFGFSEGAPNTTRAANITVSGNTIEQGGNNATAVAIFNTDGVTLDSNTVTFADGTSGRRGFNIDGDTDVIITNNSLAMDPENTDLQVGQRSPWGIQLSMSNAPTSSVRIENNAIVGGDFGIIGLSQRNLSDLKIVSNKLESYVGIALNSGVAAPVGNELRIQNVEMNGNDIRAFFNGIRLRSLHVGSKSVTFASVSASGNRVVAAGPTTTATFVEQGATFVDVKLNGNPLRKE